MNYGSCIRHLELDIYFDEDNYHDSPRARVKREYWLSTSCRQSRNSPGNYTFSYTTQSYPNIPRKLIASKMQLN